MIHRERFLFLKPVSNIFAFFMASMIWVYCAGFIFIVLVHGDLNNWSYDTLYRYAYYYPEEITYKRIGLSMLICSPIMLMYAYHLLIGTRKLFGDAKLANWLDIKKAKLLGKTGIVIGKINNHLLMFGGGLHTLLAAPTGSGKSMSIVVPTLLTWRDSVVCVDMKKELFWLTSLFRRLCGQEVYFLNFMATDYKTHRWNPLHYISKDPNFRIGDILRIANMIFRDDDKKNKFWKNNNCTLFLGICLYIIEIEGKLTIGEVLRLSQTGGDCIDFFKDEIAKGNLSRDCCDALNAYVENKSDRTRSDIISGFHSDLLSWRSALVDASTADNDFDLRDIRRKRMSIYLAVSPDNLEEMGPIIGLFFKQLIDLNTRELPSHDKSLKYQCLLLMDEFAALGKIDSISKGIAYLRGFGLRLLCVVQSPSQLIEIYGQHAADNFQQNNAAFIVFPPKASDIKTAEDISKWLGYQTVKGKSVSTSLFSNKNPNITESEQKRALLLPQEITGMKKGKELIVMEGCPPILADMAYFYNDMDMVKRLKMVSPTLKAIRGFPSEEDYEKAVVAGELAAPIPTIFINNNETIPMPTKVKNRFIFDWDNINVPDPGDMDENVLNSYADALCAGAGV